MLSTHKYTKKVAQVMAVVLIFSFLMAFGLWRLIGTSASEDFRKASTGFAGRYNEVQKQYQERTEEVRKGTEAAKENSDPETTLQLYGELLAASQQARDAFSRFSPPTDLKPTYDTMNELLDRRIEALTQLINAARSNDSAAVGIAAQTLIDVTVDYHNVRRQFETALSKCGKRCR